MQEGRQGKAKLFAAELLPCSIFLHLLIITSLVEVLWINNSNFSAYSSEAMFNAFAAA